MINSVFGCGYVYHYISIKSLFMQTIMDCSLPKSESEGVFKVNTNMYMYMYM